MSSKFSPRMDFNQWKPLTGRGDPLRNDPTYDYEPPVLERVHYWADDPRPERDHRPERKSEVLMLGISSLKQNLMSRMPSRRPHKPTLTNYEDFNYKLSEHFPMTILVPPPPPPPALKPTIFNFNVESTSSPVPTPDRHSTEQPHKMRNEYTVEPPQLNSLYALQEANLIYQSSTTHNNWFLESNETNPKPDIPVNSDYAGWGPTTTINDESSANDTHNIIVKDNFKIPQHPYLFYKPVLSEAPPPPQITPSPLLLPTFVPTVLPPLTTTTQSLRLPTEPVTTFDYTTTDFESDTNYNLGETPTSTETSFSSSNKDSPQKLDNNIFGMFESMMSMPINNGSDKPGENLYQHASENMKTYKKPQKEDELKLEFMQTLQPPPPQPQKTTEGALLKIQPSNSNGNNGFGGNRVTLDPYLNMRFATSPPTVASLLVEAYENQATTTEPTVNPTYLIIQGHSKVKKYGSKPNKNTVDTESSANEIPKPNETDEVKHLHSLKTKTIEKNTIMDKVRKHNARNLKTLINDGIGSIEIQEADIGIKYDISDGSDVPIEVYRKGIVESDENVYISKSNKLSRNKRQIDLEDLLPFDEDQIEEYVYNFLNSKKNETGITALIASAVTSDLAETVEDEIDDDDER